jgi:predicted DNA-binding WGR domain protein
MRRFEMVEGSSSKFWEVELGDASFEVRWGRIGTSGQSQTKTFSSAAKARAEHDRLIKDKAGMAGPPEPPKPARTAKVAPAAATAAMPDVAPDAGLPRSASGQSASTSIISRIHGKQP